jgi:glycine cleavage system H protein
MHFTASHEWIRVGRDGVGTVGITLHAQKELGEIVYIQLPKVGDHIKVDEEVAVLESTKAAADIYSPVSGKILSVNGDLKAINTDPEGSGWIYTIELAKSEELDRLLDKEKYFSLIT